MIAIVDYGVGNLYSIRRSLNYLNLENIISSDENEIRKADKIILPGVGAFSDAVNKLRSTRLDDVIKDEISNGKPLLGICLGMQMLFENSYEHGFYEGLGFIEGSVKPIFENNNLNLKIPQMGWNAINKRGNSPLMKYVNEGDYVYFVHSYSAQLCDKSVIATTEYGITVTAAVQKKNVFGTQFHPEKSGKVGLLILRAFSEL